MLDQITTPVNNAAIEIQERNQRFLKKCFSTIFYGEKKMGCEENFEDVKNEICNLGDTNLQIHFQMMANG